MDWSIQQIARLAGTTSRTLRHYDDIGLLPPSRVAANGYRYYNSDALVRLQRVLLLRELGLGLPAIGEIVAGRRDDIASLSAHLEWLRAEEERLARQIASVALTITALEKGEHPMAEDMFDGFDNSVHRREVEERWGVESFATSNAWWQAKSDKERAEWAQEQKRLAADWSAAAARGVDPTSDEAMALARRQFQWLAEIPGTPRDANGPTKAYVTGLAELYVADERFAANYGGVDAARFVRDAMIRYADLTV